MDYVTSEDGQTHINIGSLAKTPLGKWLSYYDPTPKKLQDGRTFYLYAGYYYFLIVKGHHPRFLRAKTHKDLQAQKRFDYTNVPGLPEKLGCVLNHNLQQSSLVLSWIQANDLPVVWYEPDRELSNAEKRWVRVVNMVLKRIRQQYSQR